MHGDLELVRYVPARGRGGGCLKRSGAREACCRSEDVEASGGVEIWRSGHALQVCRRGGVKAWSPGALEVCCRHVDVERYETLEACYRCVNVECRGMELWRRAAGV